MLELQRDGYRGAAVTSICLPLELTFVIVAKLLVLHRLQLLATNHSQPRVRNLLGRLFLAAVISLGIVGFCGNFDHLKDKAPLDLGGWFVSDDHTSVQWFRRAKRAATIW